MSLNGQFFVTQDHSPGRETQVWQVIDGKLLCSVVGEYKKISPDGQFLITDKDKKTKVWLVTKGKLLCSVEGKYETISPDGQFLVIGENRETKVWSLMMLIVPMFITQPIEKITVQDLSLLKSFQRSDIQSTSGKFQKSYAWLKFLIKLAEYKLRFDVGIEDIPINILGEFDIDIE